MAGDYSRFSFKPVRDVAGVFMQQGRVQLDADWNEMAEVLLRRLQVGTLDIVGRAAVPREKQGQEPDGFKIGFNSGDLTIGPGRIYVDGLLAENHGASPTECNRVLGEERGTKPTPYAEQPYLPNAIGVAPLPASGTHLVYLDVWQREVTALEEPALVEKAVGVDTATRVQTAWQVKLLAAASPGFACTDATDEFFSKQQGTKPSAGRLTTKAVDTPKSTDPCILPPTGGYRGTENRLFRVEIHTGGKPGAATFKWSRDNASFGSAVIAIEANTSRKELTLALVGRDKELRFAKGDWVEITDDWHELAGEPGHMSKIAADPDQVKRTITISDALPAAFDPTAKPSRHTRVRRWDQSGIVKDQTGALLVNLDAAASGGVITVPSSSATAVVLEDGIVISFDTDPSGGEFRSGDFWVFAARTVDASVETLEKAPPRGILHHYCPLAIVTFPSTVLHDCRVFWPPDAGAPAKGCACMVCVTPEAHNSGMLTIHKAIEDFAKTGGKICLCGGQFILKKPLVMDGLRGITLCGQGLATILSYESTGAGDAALTIKSCIDIDIADLVLVSTASAIAAESSLAVSVRDCGLVSTAQAGAPGPTLTVKSCSLTRIEGNILFHGTSSASAQAALALEGLLVRTVVRDNFVLADIGVGGAASKLSSLSAGAGSLAYLAAADLCVEDNLIFATTLGIGFDGLCFHLAETRLAGNTIGGSSKAGISCTGAVLAPLLPGSHLDITGNTISSGRTCLGIECGTDDARVTKNDISAQAGAASSHGIVLVTGLLQSGSNPKGTKAEINGLERCEISGNRITALAGDGIHVQTHITSASIAENVIEGVGGGGITMAPALQASATRAANPPLTLGSSAQTLGIRDNQVLGVASRPASGQAVAGIRLCGVEHGEVVGNLVRGVGTKMDADESRRGIAAEGCSSLHIAGNRVEQIGKPESKSECIGVVVERPFERLHVVDNSIIDMQSQGAGLAPRPMRALLIRGEQPPRRPIDSLPRGGQTVTVSGNTMDGPGEYPTVEISATGACAFATNHCLRKQAGESAVVVLVGGAAIVNGNYVEDERNSKTPAISVMVPKAAPGAAAVDAVTVLGNITTSEIRVNQAPLALQWSPLNVIIP